MPSCQSSSLISKIGARGPCPAELTKTSTRPHLTMTASTSFCMSPLDLLVPVIPMPPNSLASASPLPDEDRMATLNPSAARRRALSAPMPLPPPMMIATFLSAIVRLPAVVWFPLKPTWSFARGLTNQYFCHNPVENLSSREGLHCETCRH